VRRRLEESGDETGGKEGAGSSVDDGSGGRNGLGTGLGSGRLALTTVTSLGRLILASLTTLTSLGRLGLAALFRLAVGRLGRGIHPGGDGFDGRALIVRDGGGSRRRIEGLGAGRGDGGGVVTVSGSVDRRRRVLVRRRRMVVLVSGDDGRGGSEGEDGELHVDDGTCVCERCFERM
jgi:hypothetical protein